MRAILEIHRRILARNTLINLLGQVLPLAVAVVALPLLVDGLGADRFGILAIAWMALGYFAELGFGQATTKFTAEVLGRGERSRAGRIIWTTVAVQSGIGLLAGGVLALATPTLVTRVIEIPDALLGEARLSFYLVAVVLPVIVLGSSFRGALEAAQRFDLLNAVRAPAAIANYLLPLGGLALGWRLPGILALLLGSRIAVLCTYYLLARQVLPTMRGRPRPERSELRAIVSYGSWATVSRIVSPVLVHLDRFMLGALVSVAAVGLYSAPFELILRLLVLPMSLVAALFPAFSALQGKQDRARIGRLAAQAVKYVFIAVGMVSLVIVIAAPGLLDLWLGGEFARESATALRILAVGVLANSLALVPSSLLQGLGRPDVPAKFHLLELPVHAVMVIVLINAWGISGAAAAWTLRVTLDAVLLFIAAHRMSMLPAARLRGLFRRAGPERAVERTSP